VLVVAKPVKHAHDGFRRREHVGDRQELVQRRGRPAHRRGAAAGGHSEATHLSAVLFPDDRAPADVVNRRERVVLGATLEGDLELARQRCAELVPQEVARQRLGVRRDVEQLVGGNPRPRAGGDVAHRIAAGFTRRQALFGEAAHHELDVVQLQEVQLDVLPRRDVREAPGVLLRDVGERDRLAFGEHALRDLHAQHLCVFRLALAVRAAHQPERAPLIRADLAAFELCQRVGELVDVGPEGEGRPSAAQGGGVVHR